MKKNKNKSWREKMPWKLFAHKKTVMAVYFVLRILVLLAMIHQFIVGHYDNVFLCLLTLVLFLLPSFLERKLKIELPNALEIVILCFIFAGAILGEISQFYVLVPHWDTWLHTINGFLFAAVGFAVVNIFNEDKHIAMQLSPLSVALVAFCFSMTIGVLWEFLEWSADLLLGFDMQKDMIVTDISSVMLHPEGKNETVTLEGIRDVIVILEDGTQVNLGLHGYLDIGLMDTMKDLLVNLIGAVVFSFLGYFYVKTKGKGKIAQMFIPQVETTPQTE
jgi:hypothetical protein